MSDASATERASRWISAFGAALEAGDIDGALGLFGENCYWRDLVSFTWNITTLEGAEQIRAMLAATLAEVKPSGFALEGEASVVEGATEAWFTFETAVARGRGLVRFKDDKCWTLLTTMAELRGHEEPQGPTRAPGVRHGQFKDRLYYVDFEAQKDAELGYMRQPYCVIVGGGQCGIALAARLKQLAVPTIIVDQHTRPGDAWRKRYKSLCLHDPVWYDHLPYRAVSPTLAGVLAQGQDRRLARDPTSRSWSSTTGARRAVCSAAATIPTRR